MYDVAIAGASFAGLAVATQLRGRRGRVVIVDHQPVGEGQTSACGTTVSALQAVGALDTIQQVHHTLVLHLAPQGERRGRTLTYRLPEPFCTFDYRALCVLLADRARGRGVEIVRARATGHRGGQLLTDSGPIDARCVVDATGWRAAVASSIDARYVRREHLSCGLETELSQPAGIEGLHFWAGLGTVWPGYAWSFPAGPVARLGVIAYPEAGESPSKGLREALDAFLDGPGAAYWSPDGTHPRTASRGNGAPTDGRHLHGGFLPAAPRRPVVGGIFVVGDAAGHCFGLTGEGIRPAIALALACGRYIQEALDGRSTLAAARTRYGAHVGRRIAYWRLMRLLQRLVGRMGDRGLARYSRAAHPAPMFRFLMGQYLWPTQNA
jgi:flavin-dependent dehydrogenase